MAADPIVRTYDPKLIVMAFGGVLITGYAAGTFVQVARNGDSFEKVKGADGGVDRVNRNASDFAVTITIKQTSITNDLLSAIFEQDRLTNTGKLPLTIKDLNGTALFSAPQAWIGKDPDDEYGESMSNRQWRFDTGIAAKFTGGNIL